jgi:putative endonuclease
LSTREERDSSSFRPEAEIVGMTIGDDCSKQAIISSRPVAVKQYCVYIMASKTRRLYVGMTSHLMRRVYEHKHKLLGGFTARYNIKRLVHYEATSDVWAALRREKEIKGWRREKKVALIESANPEWRDLAEEFLGF